MNAFVSDDHQPTRERVSQVLESEGFTVRRFETADSAAAALSVPTCAVDLVVTDVQMPGDMDGVDLATMLALTRPNLPVVVMSSDPHELQRATDRGLDVPTLDKPFGSKALVAAVADARLRRSRGRSVQVRLPNRATDRLPSRVADPRGVLAAMFREAEAAAHPHVGSEHVALAAVEGPGGFAEIAARAGLDPAGLRAALLGCCTTPESDGERGLTFRTAMLVAVAAQLALVDQSPTVRSLDLVAALLGTPQAMAWAGLTSAGLDHRLVVETMRDAMAPGSVKMNRSRLS
jgi:Response regulator containing CheY-like receiver, AAA-type ATPase, and DNA-binding domains